MLECLLQRRGVSFALRFHLSAMTCFIHAFQNETDNLFLSPICPAACPCSVGECRLAILLQRREVAFPLKISNNYLFSSEFHDLPLTWESGAEVPSWLSGTYVRLDRLCQVPKVGVDGELSPQERSSSVELQWKSSTKVHILAGRLWKAPQFQVFWVKGDFS